MNILFLDTETTGLDAGRNSVIQIAAEYHENGKMVKSFNQKCLGAANSHSRKINLGALKVNRTKMSEIYDAAFSASEMQLAYNFVDFLLSLNSKEQLIVCGASVHFDLGFINKLLECHSIEGLDALVSHRVLDITSIAMFLKDAGVLKVEKASLDGMASHFGIATSKDRHEAMYDTKLTAELYYKLVELAKDLNIVVNSR